MCVGLTSDDDLARMLMCKRADKLAACETPSWLKMMTTGEEDIRRTTTPTINDQADFTTSSVCSRWTRLTSEAYFLLLKLSFNLLHLQHHNYRINSLIMKYFPNRYIFKRGLQM
jgi:hypothetical protein